MKKIVFGNLFKGKCIVDDTLLEIFGLFVYNMLV